MTPTFSMSAQLHQLRCVLGLQPPGVSLTTFTLALGSKQEGSVKEPEAYLCVWMAEVPEPFPHSALISQTPLLSVHSELVCGEMSLCCGLETVSSSVCCSGKE